MEKQPLAIHRMAGEIAVLSPGMTGLRLDEAGMRQFIATHYHPEAMSWFNDYEKAWSAWSIAARLPDRPTATPRWAHDFISMIPDPDKVIPGIPAYFLLAWAGMLAAMLMPGPLRMVRVAWIAAMLFTWYAATMVGVTNARFRFAYDPFCYMYAVAAVVWVIGGIARIAGGGRKPIGRLNGLRRSGESGHL
jgi:hypothetical protein